MLQRASRVRDAHSAELYAGQSAELYAGQSLRSATSLRAAQTALYVVYEH